MTAALFSTRPWLLHDLPFLREMLYLSIHVPEGAPPPPRTVLDLPDIAHYLTGFGIRHGDDAEIAVDAADVPIGAAFCRLMPAEDPGYGFVAPEVPEVGMSVSPAWRGRGVGRRLLVTLLERHPTMSLSVDTDNTGAAGLYRSLGFADVATVGTSVTMLRDLRELRDRQSTPAGASTASSAVLDDVLDDVENR